MRKAANFTFRTRDWAHTHGRPPDGVRGWAFCWRSTTDPEFSEPIFAPPSTYSQAKRWLMAQLAGQVTGEVEVKLCP